MIFCLYLANIYHLKIYQQVQGIIYLSIKKMPTNQLAFILSLRVTGEVVKLSIESGQTIDEVFQKLRKVYPKSINKKAEIIEKLRESLQGQIEMRRIKPSSLQAIEEFMRKSFPQNNNSRVLGILQNNHSLNLAESNMQQSSPQKSKNHYQIIQNPIITIGNLPSQSQQSNPPSYKPQNPNPDQNTVLSITNKSKPLRPSKKSRCNPDVIKACETIMKKVQNTEMKLMARQFLKQKGYWKQEKERTMSMQNQKCNGHTNPVFTQIQQQVQRLNNVKIKCTTECSEVSSEFPINVLNKFQQNSKTNPNNRAHRYNYLQSSLANESYLSKEFQLSKDYQTPCTAISDQIVPSKPKKYSYLQSQQ